MRRSRITPSKPCAPRLILGLVTLAACSDDSGDADTLTPTTASATASTSLGSSTSTAGTTTGDESTSTSAAGTTTSDVTSSATASTTSPTGDPTGESTTDTSTTGTSTTDTEGTTGGPPLNLLKNPSFEVWTDAMEPNTTPDEWLLCLADGIALDAVPDSCMATPAEASDGARYGRSSAGEGVMQVVATTPGETYRVTFDYTGVSGCFGGSPNSVWDVLVDGAVILTTPSHPEPGWKTAEITFVAASTSTELCLRTPDGSGQGGLDNVSMTLD